MILTLFALAAAAPPAPAAQDTGYFQQGVDYRIEARLDEQAQVLRGRARLRYTNRSRTTLDSLYVHQHLNAFRPNSAWARRELALGVRRFQDLGPADHAFERFTAVSVDGRQVRPAYPGSPDSTVAAIPLPRPLAPGASVTVVMDWDARPSTLPRRQGRRGRQWDMAQWYPRIAVFDHTGWAHHALMPQGEFYGEFAAYDVTLDLPADQVVGSTGVVVEGDPGYPVSDVEKNAYPARAAEPLGFLQGAPGAGRKRVRWRAADVHHFAWSASPDFQHEGVTRMSIDDAGTRKDLPPIHVLYLPADTAWRNVVARRTYDALSWLQGKFGPYPWPQLTNLHRLESGGTEFPMLVMNGSPSEGLIVHEVTHQYLHGIFANNEWREGWMDEGFTSFMDTWYEEEKGRADAWRQTMEGMARVERGDSTQPVGLPGPAYRDPRMYSTMTYTKASVVFRMLRELVGTPTFERILRDFYAGHRLRHVTGEDFERTASRVAGRDLDWFFDQWIERTDKLDYAVTGATASRGADGRWRTRVTVTRQGEAWMPTTLRVGGVTRTLESRERSQVVEVDTPERPTEVVLDPNQVNLETDWTNNRAPVTGG